MQVMVIGLGSMGRRRIRLLRQFDNLIDIIGVDSLAERRDTAQKTFDIKTYDCVDAVFNDNKTIEVAFVSTSPLSHSGLIHKCLNNGNHVFSEINLVDDGYEINEQLAKDRGVVLFLSSTFMYRREIEYLKEVVSERTLDLSYIYHVGQYLPDWHPWENYKEYFVGDKKTNACRELMAIEFPWLFDIFGNPQESHVLKKKNSMLDINYPDLYQIQFIHPNGCTGMVQIDVVSRKPVRNFECISDDLYISWDGTPYGLIRYDYMEKQDISVKLYDSVDKRNEYNDSIIEDAYYSEIKTFFDTIKGKATPRYSFARDKEILSIIDNIEGNR